MIPKLQRWDIVFTEPTIESVAEGDFYLVEDVNPKLKQLKDFQEAWAHLDSPVIIEMVDGTQYEVDALPSAILSKVAEHIEENLPTCPTCQGSGIGDPNLTPCSLCHGKGELE